MILMDIYMTLTTQWNNVKKMLWLVAQMVVILLGLAPAQSAMIGRCPRELSITDSILYDIMSFTCLGMISFIFSMVFSHFIRTAIFFFPFIITVWWYICFAVFIQIFFATSIQIVFTIVCVLAFFTGSIISNSCVFSCEEFRKRFDFFALAALFAYDGFRHFCSFATKMFRTAQRAMNPLGSLYFSGILAGGQF